MLAAGMEVVGAVLDSVGAPIWMREVEVFLEEALEMVGVWLFLAGVLSVLRGTMLRLVTR